MFHQKYAYRFELLEIPGAGRKVSLLKAFCELCIGNTILVNRCLLMRTKILTLSLGLTADTLSLVRLLLNRSSLGLGCRRR